MIGSRFFCEQTVLLSLRELRAEDVDVPSAESARVLASSLEAIPEVKLER